MYAIRSYYEYSEASYRAVFENAEDPRYWRPVRWLTIAVVVLFAVLAAAAIGAAVFFV